MKNREEFGRNLGAVDQYLDLIEQMVKQDNSFSSHGSGSSSGSVPETLKSKYASTAAKGFKLMITTKQPKKYGWTKAHSLTVLRNIM